MDPSVDGERRVQPVHVRGRISSGCCLFGQCWGREARVARDTVGQHRRGVTAGGCPVRSPWHRLCTRPRGGRAAPAVCGRGQSVSGCSLGKSKQTSQASWWPLTLLLPRGSAWRWRVAAKGQKARTPEGVAGGRPVRWRHRPGLPPATAVCFVAVVTPVRPSYLPGVLSGICGLSQRVMLQRGRGGRQ